MYYTYHDIVKTGQHQLCSNVHRFLNHHLDDTMSNVMSLSTIKDLRLEPLELM